MQRIFDVARKLGTPVIMTDPAGREPLVVLPLDQFEAMAGISSDQVETAAMSEPVVQAQRQNVDKKTHNKAKKEQSLDLGPDIAAVGVEAQDIPIEERFYLEPLEGGDGLEA